MRAAARSPDQSIASGTGATYRHLDDPAQLPDLYRQLAGDIIGGGTDTDHDGLSDCVERNGMFVVRKLEVIAMQRVDGHSTLRIESQNVD